MQKAMETLPKQILQNMQTELIFSQEDSHVNHSQLQGNEKEQKMKDTSGPKCLERYEKLNPVGLWAKMLAESLVGMEGWYSNKCILTWKLKGTKYKRLYFQLAPSMRPIDETGYGLLPIVSRRDGEKGGDRSLTLKDGKWQNLSHSTGREFGMQIDQAIRLYLLPTPISSDATTGAIIGKNDTFKETSGLPRKINQNGKDGSVGLGRLVKLMLPTPKAGDWKDTGDIQRLADLREKSGQYALVRELASQMLITPSASDGTIRSPMNMDTLNKRFQKHPNGNLSEQIADKTKAGQNFQLAPQFVLEMMGFPTDWTLLPFQEGIKHEF